MATFNKFNSFVEAMAEKTHNLGSDQLSVALTNTIPLATNTVLTNITEIANYANLSGDRNITTSSSTQTAGLYKLVVADKVLEAIGTVGPFQYVVLYNSTSIGNELIGWYDYGSAVTLNAGDSFTIDFDQINGVLTIQ